MNAYDSSYAIGLMTGTSIDGIDAILAEITETESEYPLIHPLTSLFSRFNPDHRTQILDLCRNDAPIYDIARLHMEMGHWLADTVNRLLQKVSIPPSRIRIIGMHGQTIAHYPPGQTHHQGFTVQIGDPAIVAAETEIDVVSHFRQMDMAMGGQGAPLVPYFDYAVFRSFEESRVLLNIGGIANITIIPPKAKIDEIMGFDTGPGNMVLDALMEQLTAGHKHYDNSGELASHGNKHNDLITQWLHHPYFSKNPPKSCGREEFGREYTLGLLRQMREMGLSSPDMMRTATAFVATTIKNAISQYVPTDIALIAAGGGCHNPVLMKELAQELPLVRPWESTDGYGIPGDMKEALAFAYLAWQFVHNRPTSVFQITGAQKSVRQGMLTPKGVSG